MLLLWVSSCGFHPAGPTPGDPDAPPPEDAPPDVDDAPAIDGPAPIDAPVPIDAAIDARPPCPAGYNVATNSGRYALRHIAMQHGVAEADCNDDLPGRTHLATWETPGSFDPDLAILDPGNNAIVFVGAGCSGIDCADATRWMWNTGVRVDESLWEPGQPDNTLIDRIGVAVRTSGEWRLQNLGPTETRPYICECDP